MFPFCTRLKHQKTKGEGDAKRENWPDMDNTTKKY